MLLLTMSDLRHKTRKKQRFAGSSYFFLNLEEAMVGGSCGGKKRDDTLCAAPISTLRKKNTNSLTIKSRLTLTQWRNHH